MRRERALKRINWAQATFFLENKKKKYLIFFPFEYENKQKLKKSERWFCLQASLNAQCVQSHCVTIETEV